MNKNDLAINYMVTKKEEYTKKVDMKKLILLIRDYVQNSEVYFKHYPEFKDGVLLFNIVGFKEDHKVILEKLGKSISDCGCKLGLFSGSSDIFK